MDTVVINNIIKKFEHTTAIDDLTLTIPTGQMTGIVGADAAGKTTLLRIIIGLLCADLGTVTTLGYDPARQKKSTYRSNRLYAAKIWTVRRPERT